MSSSSDQRPSPTAVPSRDALGLGPTQGQRGAEILAGLRADLMPSMETQVLSSRLGRIVGRMIKTIENNEAALNFISARYYGFKWLLNQAIQQVGESQLTIVLAGAGFSPRGYQLANTLPEVKLIEIDLPDVTKEKQRRLRQVGPIPENMSWIGADLGVHPLSEFIQNEQVDIILAEGLLAYFLPEEMTRIGQNIRTCLKPGGVFFTDVTSKPGIERIKDSARFFSRQAGKLKGIVPDKESAQKVFLDAGYDRVEAYLFSELPEIAGLPAPVIDFAYLISAWHGRR